jgi:hypothetical protein
MKINLKDYVHSGVAKKLYEVPRYSLVCPINQEELILLFSHIDGAYSFCKNMENEIVHLAAWSDVHILEKKNA